MKYKVLVEHQALRPSVRKADSALLGLVLIIFLALPRMTFARAIEPKYVLKNGMNSEIYVLTFRSDGRRR